MTARFVSNLVTLLAGAFLTSAALGFAASSIGWLGFAVGCVVATTVLLAFTLPGRGLAQRALDCSITALSAWTIVASRSFGGATLHWLSFAAGVGLLVLATVALIVHETLVELALRRTVALHDDRRVIRVQERHPAGLMQ
ncbi:MAG: hypothetical protein ACYCUM_13430 [Solirubrobacteraceae bacterium]